MAASNVFKPLKIGNAELQHRIVMAPLTRFRADENGVQLPMAVKYYAQRAVVPGTLIISEATNIAPRPAAGAIHAPGIWTEEQISRWKEITAAVHARGSFIFCQLFAPGRAGAVDALQARGYPLDAPSAIPMSGGATPRELTDEEIRTYIAHFAQAAKNAMRAGFDGVEIHGANGYLVDQFTQENSNRRTDRWGGSIENRSRFAVEVARAVADAIGPERLGFRVSPWSTFQDMRMADPVAQFADLVGSLKMLKLGYLHIIEARVTNSLDIVAPEKIDWLLDLWENQSPVILAGGFKPDQVRHYLNEVYGKYTVALAFGRYFLSTPDLPFRIKYGIPPNSYNRASFYTPMQAEGYLDYPFSPAFLEEFDPLF